MPVLSGAAVVLLQDSDVIALALVMQAIGVVISAVFAAKLLHRVNGIADVVEKRTGPMLDKTNQILNDLAPKVQSFTENAEQISYTVRTKVDELGVTVSELNETVREINGRTRVQVSRVDDIVTDALVATEEISHTVQQGIKAPVRQIAGIIAGLRAGIETLIERSPFKGKK
jgi:methyl-accepting chemotaxis protein